MHFTDGGRKRVAGRRYDTGTTDRFPIHPVFAVGDASLHTEYCDARRLPAGYDNARATRDLFRWLLAAPRREMTNERV